MECLQSFNIRINQAIVTASANGYVRTWGTPGQYYFAFLQTPTTFGSLYNLEGFKNTDIYGISVTGFVQGYNDPANKCAVVEDWSFGISLDGNAPLVSGTKRTSPDGFNIITKGTQLNTIILSKNTNSINFLNPYQSVKSISFNAIQAQGHGAEALTDIAILYDLMFTFYYKYEGE